MRNLLSALHYITLIIQQKMADSKETEGLDLDWFAVDHQGYVGHIASMGGDLPLQLSINDCETLSAYFWSQPLTSQIISSEQIDKWMSFKDGEEKKRYLDSFSPFAQRGLFSFDRILYSTQYCLVSSPTKPIKVYDLPESIQLFLTKVKQPNSLFKTVNILSLDDFA